MNVIGVNIIANKTFANAAEELLTRKSQFIHSLLTELSSFADEHCGKLKRESDRRKVIAQYTTLTRSLITGYREGVAGTEPPGQRDTICDCEQTVKYLSAPYRAKGFEIACRQIEHLISRGEHKSCARARPQSDRTDEPNSTQGPPADRSS